jgi:hypothetical protein
LHFKMPPTRTMKSFHLALAFLFFALESFAKKVPTPDRVDINAGPRPFSGRGPIRGPGGPENEKVPPAWSSHQHVFTGTLNKIVDGPVGRSFPPMFTHKLTFTVKEVMRGDLKPGDQVTASHVVRQRVRPVFPEGKDCIVGGEKSRGSLQAKDIVELDFKQIKTIRLACALPLGWSGKIGNIRSPWATLPAKWPVNTKEEAKYFCKTTGRPALGFGSGASFKVEKVPPDREIKWTNPDGDGDYKITVENLTQEPVIIPALRRIGSKILWRESLAILCQDKPYPAPGSKGVSVETLPFTLRPGQKVSGIINPLALEGPNWPKGGYRISFQICLGEKSSTQSFYYMTRHHDAIRKRLKAGKPIRSVGD